MLIAGPLWSCSAISQMTGWEDWRGPQLLGDLPCSTGHNHWHDQSPALSKEWGLDQVCWAGQGPEAGTQSCEIATYNCLPPGNPEGSLLKGDPLAHRACFPLMLWVMVVLWELGTMSRFLLPGTVSASFLLFCKTINLNVSKFPCRLDVKAPAYNLGMCCSSNEI